METQAINLTAAIMAMGCLIFSLVVLYYRGPDAFLQAAREWTSIIERQAAILAALAAGWGIQWATWCAQWFGFLEHLAAILAALATAAGIHWQQWRAAWWANVKGAATWRGNYD